MISEIKNKNEAPSLYRHAPVFSSIQENKVKSQKAKAGLVGKRRGPYHI